MIVFVSRVVYGKMGMSNFHNEVQVQKRLPFHQQLKHERLRRGWSREDLASKIGSDPRTVARWESGKSLPRSYYQQEICKLFGKDVEELGLLNVEAEEAKECENLPGQDLSGPEGQCVERVLHPDSPPMGATLLTYDIHSSWVVALDWERCGT